MSMFSGKCDLYDWIHTYNFSLEELQSNVKIYIGDNNEPLIINKISDLIQYYPYTVRCSYVESKRRITIIHLSSESWVDIEERRVLEFYKRSLDKMYKRYKRKGLQFIASNVIEKLDYLNDTDALECIATRMENIGIKASIEGIHLKNYDFYRKLLAEEMIKNRIDPVRCGYERVMG